MIISFVISIFDITDVSEVCLADNTPLFSTSNPNADNPHDSLTDNGFQYTTVENFFLPAFPRLCNIKRTLLHELEAEEHPVFFYNFNPPNNGHPPIV